MTARLTTLVVAIFAIVALAGCGGDDDSGSAGAAVDGDGTVTTSSLSKAQFIKQANGVCRREKASYSKEILPSVQRFRSEGLSEHDAAIKALQAVLLPITEAQITGVRELGAPAGDEEEVEAALDAEQEAVDEFKAATPAEAGEDPSTYFADANKELQNYGLTACVVTL